MIAPMIHRCVVPSGDLAGNKAAHEVTSADIEYGQECEVCGARIAPWREVIAHIYGELTNENQG